MLLMPFPEHVLQFCLSDTDRKARWSIKGNIETTAVLITSKSDRHGPGNTEEKKVNPVLAVTDIRKSFESFQGLGYSSMNSIMKKRVKHFGLYEESGI